MALLECIAFFAHEGFNKNCKVVYALKITAHIVHESIYKKYLPTFDHSNGKKVLLYLFCEKLKIHFKSFSNIVADVSNSLL